MTETCDLCGDSFDSQKGLHIHQSKVHSEPQNECPVCGDTFDSKRGLSVHRTQMHENESEEPSEEEPKDIQEPEEPNKKGNNAENESLSEQELVQIIGGEIKHLEKFLEKERSIETLKRLLEDEKLAQDRIEAKKMLQEKINQKEFGKDFDQALEELEQMKTVLTDMKEKELGERDFDGHELENIEPMTAVNLIEGDFARMKKFIEEKNPSLDQIDELIEAESNGKVRERVLELLKSTKHQKRLFIDIKEAQNSIKEVENDLKNIMDDSSYVHPKSLEDYGPHKAVESGENEKRELREKISEYGVEESELEGKDIEELETLLEKLRKKEEIIEELDLDLDDQEISEIQLESLEKLEEEQKEREKLIDRLKDEGMDEEMLRDSSTPDLKKLSQNIDEFSESEGKNQNSDSSENNSTSKDEEEIEKEAEEDLRMLMGAVKSEETDEEDQKKTVEQIREYKQNIKEIFSKESEKKKEEENRYKKVIELLEDYRELGREEKAIKTAHVMKGYLEFKMSIPHELTYQELAEELDQKDNPELEILTEFFEKMAEDQYLEKIEIENMNQVIEAAEQTAKNMG